MSPDYRRILVVEPRATGHHGVYAAWIADGLRANGFEVAVASTESALKHPSLSPLQDWERSKEHVYAFPGSVPSGRELGVFGLAQRELRLWALFSRWYQRVHQSFEPDLVFVAYLDHMLYAASILGSPFGDTPWVGIAMRPSFHYREVGILGRSDHLASLKGRLFGRLLRQRKLAALYTIDESLVSFMDNRRTGRKVHFIPQPVWGLENIDKAAARERLGLADCDKVMLLFGQISRRKGVNELLEATQHPLFPPNLTLFFLGAVDAEASKVLTSELATALRRQGRLRLMSRFATSDEEAAAFSAADFVWMGYKDHYAASGVLAHAAAKGLPVIASVAGLAGWQTRRHDLGLCVDPGSAAAVATAASQLSCSKSGTETATARHTDGPLYATASSALERIIATWE